MSPSIHDVTRQAPPLLPLLRSAAQARVLSMLLLQPERVWTVSGLAEAAGVSQPTATREVQRLSGTGVVVVDGGRNARRVSVDPTAVLYPELSGLVLKAFGPLAVLAEELSDVRGIQHASIFGSWAQRYLGEPGQAPMDIDVLVVGRPDMDAVADAVSRAGGRLGREVAPTVLTAEEWTDGANAFVRALWAAPRVPVVGDSTR